MFKTCFVLSLSVMAFTVKYLKPVRLDVQTSLQEPCEPVKTSLLFTHLPLSNTQTVISTMKHYMNICCFLKQWCPIRQMNARNPRNPIIITHCAQWWCFHLSGILQVYKGFVQFNLSALLKSRTVHVRGACRVPRGITFSKCCSFFQPVFSWSSIGNCFLQPI